MAELYLFSYMIMYRHILSTVNLDFGLIVFFYSFNLNIYFRISWHKCLQLQCTTLDISGHYRDGKQQCRLHTVCTNPPMILNPRRKYNAKAKEMSLTQINHVLKTNEYSLKPNGYDGRYNGPIKGFNSPCEDRRECCNESTAPKHAVWSVWWPCRFCLRTSS